MATSGTVVVISKTPAGGRCTLYMGYAEEIAKSFGFAYRVDYPQDDTADPAPPALAVNGTVLEPADGVILAADEVIAGLRRLGLPVDAAAGLEERLDAAVERMLGAP